ARRGALLHEPRIGLEIHALAHQLAQFAVHLAHLLGHVGATFGALVAAFRHALGTGLQAGLVLLRRDHAVLVGVEPGTRAGGALADMLCLILRTRALLLAARLRARAVMMPTLALARHDAVLVRLHPLETSLGMLAGCGQELL